MIWTAFLTTPTRLQCASCAAPCNHHKRGVLGNSERCTRSNVSAQVINQIGAQSHTSISRCVGLSLRRSCSMAHATAVLLSFVELTMASSNVTTLSHEFQPLSPQSNTSTTNDETNNTANFIFLIILFSLIGILVVCYGWAWYHGCQKAHKTWNERFKQADSQDR